MTLGVVLYVLQANMEIRGSDVCLPEPRALGSLRNEASRIIYLGAAFPFFHAVLHIKHRVGWHSGWCGQAGGILWGW